MVKQETETKNMVFYRDECNYKYYIFEGTTGECIKFCEEHDWESDGNELELLNGSISYYEIYIETDHESKSVYVRANDENEAVEIMTDQHLYDDEEDLDNIKSVSEISWEEFKAWLTGRKKAEGKFPRKFGVVLKEKPLDEGLTRSEVMDLFDILSGVEAIPIEIQGDVNSTAMGFINLTDADWMDYDYSKLEDVVKNILNDMNNEKDPPIYECPNNNGVTTIWLSR